MKKLIIIFLLLPWISISNPFSNFIYNDVDNFKELNAQLAAEDCLFY